MKITKDFIKSFIGNASMISEGKGLIAERKFTSLYTSEDDKFLFGRCQGNGANSYRCSIDFTDSENPIARCNCPSKKPSCKHVAGLLCSKFQDKPFTVIEFPVQADLDPEIIESLRTGSKKDSETLSANVNRR